LEIGQEEALKMAELSHSEQEYPLTSP